MTENPTFRNINQIEARARCALTEVIYSAAPTETAEKVAQATETLLTICRNERSKLIDTGAADPVAFENAKGQLAQLMDLAAIAPRFPRRNYSILDRIAMFFVGPCADERRATLEDQLIRFETAALAFMYRVGFSTPAELGDVDAAVARAKTRADQLLVLAI
jgi:hypothetical protein